jgi:hypothetical protein
MNNGSLQSHVEEDDDFSSGYFDNPMSSLGGLDLDDSDPLSMAIGGLGLNLESPNRAHELTSSSPTSPIHQVRHR